MANLSKIEWTNATWNPLTGCTKISPGCKFCYAAALAKRLNSMGNRRYSNGFDLTLHEDLVELPMKWKQPKMIFVNSMSDLFHKDVPLDFIQRVFETMSKASWHTFQILTKRSDRLAELSHLLPWPKNIWMGVSVENDDYRFRIEHLKATGAQTKFLSIEPLIGPVTNLALSDIHWVIVGGESGPKSRPVQEEWITAVRDACLDQHVAFFFKQWGGVNKAKAGRILQGRTWDEFPEHLDSLSSELASGSI